ncbi:MAG: ArsR family transcriptional regulator [Thermoprotei archaeon ex4572_64]|nr:MAG: ArsR family transcriptional regulator [Thermoprotei archaeon ex4572_64]
MSVDLVDIIFSSKTRLKILKTLMKIREINITKLTRMVNVNHVVVNYHIDVLKNLGFIEEKRFGRIRIIKLNESNPKIKSLERLFEELREI